jgi:biopolymer transport protein ExbB/TolQ
MPKPKPDSSFSPHQPRHVLFVLLSHLGWPFLIGAATCSLFYALIYRGPLNVPSMHRYFASHPVLILETALFFVGLASLLLKFLDVVAQYLAINRVQLETPPPQGQRLEETGRLLSQLDRLSASVRHSYLGRRLHDVLTLVSRKGSADGLEDELKYLADMDVARQQESYGLVRIVIWATPMLGFLGTVVGITQALGDLDPKQLATDIQGAMTGLLAGLYVAFDTTALALSLSMALMFIQFLLDRIETQLLSTVDLRASEMLIGRFQQLGAATDPYLASVERMSQQVLHASEDVIRQQAQVWEATIEAAHQRWSQLVDSAESQTEAALLGALEKSLQKHATEMARLEREASERAARRWEQLQTALSDNARIMRAQQEEMIRQSDLLAQVIKATGDVKTLESALNQNLQALAGAKNFEETVMSLSAAVNLLSSRASRMPENAIQVDLQKSTAKSRAA